MTTNPKSRIPNPILEKWLAINITGYRQSKVLQYRRGDVDDFRRSAPDGPWKQCVAGYEDARRRLVVERAVVPRPFLPVGIHDPRRGAPERRLPRDAVAVGEADLQF